MASELGGAWASLTGGLAGTVGMRGLALYTEADLTLTLGGEPKGAWVKSSCGGGLDDARGPGQEEPEPPLVSSLSWWWWHVPGDGIIQRGP